MRGVLSDCRARRRPLEEQQQHGADHGEIRSDVEQHVAAIAGREPKDRRDCRDPPFHVADGNSERTPDDPFGGAGCRLCPRHQIARLPENQAEQESRREARAMGDVIDLWNEIDADCKQNGPAQLRLADERSVEEPNCQKSPEQAEGRPGRANRH